MFPAFYHVHHSQYQDDLPFWLGLADQFLDPILELGCGTGRVLVPLAQEGYRVYGVENDPEMLAYLKSNIESNLLHNIQIIEGDLTQFQIADKFSLILLPCNTYSTLDSTRRQATLRCVHTHLQNGGVFAVSIPNPALLVDLPKRGEAQIEAVFEHPESGQPVQVSSAWETGKDSMTFIWHYDHLLSDGTTERLSESTQHHLTPEQTYRNEFAQANLHVLSVYGDFEGSALNSDSPYLIFIALK